jgi:hypothetical protein
MVKPKLAKGIRMLIDFFRRNPAIPLIFGFQVLLIFCVALLLVGIKPLAQDLAVYAFVLLTIGVLLQWFLLLRHPRKTGSQ